MIVQDLNETAEMLREMYSASKVNIAAFLFTCHDIKTTEG